MKQILLGIVVLVLAAGAVSAGNWHGDTTWSVRGEIYEMHVDEICGNALTDHDYIAQSHVNVYASIQQDLQSQGTITLQGKIGHFKRWSFSWQNMGRGYGTELWVDDHEMTQMKVWGRVMKDGKAQWTSAVVTFWKDSETLDIVGEDFSITGIWVNELPGNVPHGKKHIYHGPGQGHSNI